MHVQSNAASALGDHSALLEGVIDAIDAVLLHGHKEAAAELRPRRARVEEGGRGMGKPALAHELVRVERVFDVVLVDADGHAHEHVLRALHNDIVEAQQVRALQGLEAEVVVVEVSVIDDLRVKAVSVLHNDFVDIISDQRCALICRLECHSANWVCASSSRCWAWDLPLTFERYKHIRAAVRTLYR